MQPSLLILAAGMGSRYGGLKQADPVGPHGEVLLDYSIYDAVKAGFGKVVFLIKKSMEGEFKRNVGARYAGVVDVAYAYQELDAIPAGFTVPSTRVKPWGTAHAVLASRAALNEPFAVINADDYYGPSSYRLLHEALRVMENDSKEFVMIGFRVENTLSEYGSVARGVCDVSGGFLVAITERTKVVKSGGCGLYEDEGGMRHAIPAGTMVSMNFWGFAPDTIFPLLEERFTVFMRDSGLDPKAEYFIPAVIDCAIASGAAKVRVLESEEAWFGMTYKEDRDTVRNNILRKIAEGVYPEKLFNR